MKNRSFRKTVLGHWKDKARLGESFCKSHLTKEFVSRQYKTTFKTQKEKEKKKRKTIKNWENYLNIYFKEDIWMANKYIKILNINIH